MARKNKKPIITTEDPTIYNRSKQEMLYVPCDRLKLKLIEFKDCISSKNDWLNSFGVIVGIILVLCTSDFKTFIGIEGSTWKSVFLVSLLLMIIKLFFDLVKKYKNRKISEESILTELKKGQN